MREFRAVTTSHERNREGDGVSQVDPSRDEVSWEDMVLVGRVARPHGLRGHVVVNAETDFAEERFQVGSVLWTRQGPDGVAPVTVAAVGFSGARPVVAFDGCTTVEEAERFGGLELRVPEDALRPLPAGTHYVHQLVGCTVETLSGETVGVVNRVDGGALSLLVVAGPRGEVLIPFAASICVDIDVVSRRIRVAPPDGLLELNETAVRGAGKKPLPLARRSRRCSSERVEAQPRQT